ncbi:MAG: DNA cytosine methyltransferase [Halobacteriaceae archaeon]
MANHRYTAIDLFSGAGGFSTGLEWAGFDIEWAADWDEKAAKTYQHNHPNTEFASEDLAKFDPPDLDHDEPLDLIAGGPPCPTFSVIGRAKLNSIDGREVTEDSRHQLWRDYVRYVDHYQPRAFVMENVKGMYSAENDAGQRVLPIILDEMRDIKTENGYL